MVICTNISAEKKKWLLQLEFVNSILKYLFSYANMLLHSSYSS